MVKSDAIRVRVKPHLVIDYVYSACQIHSINRKITKVTFQKLTYQNSLRISLRFFAWKYWFMLGREAKRALDDIHHNDGCDSVSTSDIEEAPPKLDDDTLAEFEDATIDRARYDEIQKGLEDIRRRGELDLNHKRLVI